MRSDRRIARLYPALYPKERAQIMLRAWKAGERYDPEVTTTVHPRDVADYNYYVDLLRGATGPLAHFVAVVSMLIGQLERQVGTLGLLQLWGLQTAHALAWLLLAPGQPHAPGAGARTRAISILGQAPLGLADAAALGHRARGHGEDHPEADWTGDQIAQGLIERLRAEVLLRWHELRAAEIVLHEVITEIGEDVLRPDVRTRFDESRRLLIELHVTVEAYGDPLELSEPWEDLVTHVRVLAGITTTS